ncbi:MAG: class I SAM-dependent methyltransferase [Nitrospiraceae bacterium]
MNVDEIKKEVARTGWWHTIDLGHGIITPGADNSPYKLRQIGLPESLSGKTVLDVGASDGFFSFEAERRGAKRVLAADVWSGQCWGMQPKTGFEIARRALKSTVESIESDVLDLSPEKIGTFDLVLFLGVLYHMRHPLLALERIFSVTGNQLILETHMERLGGKQPAMVFYPEKELNNDHTNWWGPNPAAVEAMLKSAGFRRVVKIKEYSSRDPVSLSIRMKAKLLVPYFQQKHITRVVYHAWR